MKDPFTGIGKPEPLKFVLASGWSRRITQEHRLDYRVSERRIDFLQARYYYGRPARWGPEKADLSKRNTSRPPSEVCQG